MTRRDLTPLEARVLAVLVEKESTVPDSYPLSANALTSGCNQKTARDPVLTASDGEVQGAVDALHGAQHPRVRHPLATQGQDQPPGPFVVQLHARSTLRGGAPPRTFFRSSDGLAVT